MINFLHSYRLHVIAAFGCMLYLYSLPTFFYLDATENTEGLKVYYGSFASFILLWVGYYIGNRFFDFKEDTISQPNEARRSRGMLAIVLGSYIIPLIIFVITTKPLLPFVFLILLTITYSTPLINGFRVKQLPFIKNICAAGTWWLAVSFFIHFYVEQTTTLLQACIATAIIFPTMLVIELLWDVRDIDGDRANGNRTVPVILGLTTTKIVIFGILGFCWFFGLFEAGGSTLINFTYLGLATVFVTKGFTNYFYHSIVYIQILLMLVTILLIKTIMT